jgi:signal transduction histidine kinase
MSDPGLPPLDFPQVMSVMTTDPSDTRNQNRRPQDEAAQSTAHAGLPQLAVTRLGEMAEAIAKDEPLVKVVDRALKAIAESFRITHILMVTVAEDLRPTLHWLAYGYSSESAESIVRNLETEYYPKSVSEELFAERFRVSRSCYYVPAEEWLKLTERDPFTDIPAYYRRPEDARTVRRDPGEWVEADSYLYDMKESSGKRLAWLELAYSSDNRLLSHDAVEQIELFADMIVIALLRERLRVGRDGTRLRAAQRTELLEDLLKISSSIVSERDLVKLSDMILSSVSSLFGFRRVSLVVYDEAEGVFKWVALFGYPPESVQDTRYRTIPTDVILDDLREGRRIGKSVYYTRAEDLSPRQIAHFVTRPSHDYQMDRSPRAKDEFRDYDCLAFSLHDSTGRIVGVIYPSEPKDGKMADKDTIETMEIFTSLAEVAIENARLSSEREIALRLTSQRTEQLSRILDMTSSMMYVRDLEKMLDDLLRTLAQLLGLRRMTIGVKHEELGEYTVEAVYGYSAKATQKIKSIGYGIQDVDSIYYPGPMPTSVKWRRKVGRMTFYMPAESIQISSQELVYYPDPDLIRLPRRGKEYWHELDYLDTFILDRKGVPIAYLETLKPRDDRVPDSETIEIIEIFASLAGIAIENSRVFQEHIDSRRDAELYTDILSHDIKNFNQAILGYLELLRMKLKDTGSLGLLDKISDQVMNTIWLATNVRTMSRVAFSEIEMSRIDLGAVLFQCRKSLVQYYPNKKLVFHSDVEPGRCYIYADDLVRELFVNIMTNAVRYDDHDEVEIDIGAESCQEGEKKSWIVFIGDRGRGIPDDVKAVIFDRFSKATKKGSGLGLHIVKTLAVRYGGKVWVENRVNGDPSQGSVFKVQLPAA